MRECGIGISPSYKFTVLDDTNDFYTARFENTNSINSHWVYIKTNTTSSTNTPFRVDSWGWTITWLAVRWNWNVWIGTTAPISKFEVKTTVLDQLRLSWNSQFISLWVNTSTWTWNPLTKNWDVNIIYWWITWANTDNWLTIAPWSNSSEWIRIDNVGNIWIWTTSPNKLLHLKTPTWTNAEIDIQSWNKPHWWIYQEENSEQLRFWNWSDKITFSSWGNVGIGTSSPAWPLHISTVLDAWNNSPLDSASLVIWNYTTWHLEFDDNEIHAMSWVIASDLHINADWGKVNFFGNSWSWNIFVNWNVWIWTTNPQAKLDVNWRILITWNNPCTTWADCDLVIWHSDINRHDTSLSMMSTASAIKMKLTWNTLNIRNWDWQDNTILDTYNFSARLYSNVSDFRLKKDISSINSWISTINNLRWVIYHWKDNTKDKDLQYWFIAQEVEKVLPDLVKTDDKWYKSVNYIGIIPVLVKSVQELSENNKQITDENNDLKLRVWKLEKIINNLVK